MSGGDKEYVLGTHDAEMARLGLQHQAWRPFALAGWRRAGFTAGHTLLDVGCGPGYATVDLAELAGPAGRVAAFDRSAKFLAALSRAREQRGLDNISAHEVNLDSSDLPALGADGAWCRWTLAFLKQPRELLARLAGTLRPGGVLVLHEYFDYSTWRATPRCVELESFVAAVMQSWRADGGEPDVGLSAPGWLERLGFEIRSTRPLVRVAQPRDMLWQWLRTFVEVGRSRLVELGYITAARAEATWLAFSRLEAMPEARMITPGVMEIIAVRRG